MLQCVQLLVSNGCSVNSIARGHSPLTLAIVNGHDKVFTILIPSFTHSVECLHGYHRCHVQCIHFASCVQVVQYLLSSGADPNLLITPGIDSALCAATTNSAHKRRGIVQSVQLVDHIMSLYYTHHTIAVFHRYKTCFSVEPTSS